MPQILSHVTFYLQYQNWTVRTSIDDSLHTCAKPVNLVLSYRNLKAEIHTILKFELRVCMRCLTPSHPLTCNPRSRPLSLSITQSWLLFLGQHPQHITFYLKSILSNENFIKPSYRQHSNSTTQTMHKSSQWLDTDTFNHFLPCQSTPWQTNIHESRLTMQHLNSIQTI